MRSFITGVTLAFLVVTAGFVSIQAQTTPPKALATISGRVVTIKGKGVANLTLLLRKPGTSIIAVLPRALTDLEGNYKITNVPAGSYEIFPAPSAYIVSDSSIKRLVVAEAENLENVNFALVKGGVITGKIVDADGRPVIQTMVRLYPRWSNRADAAPPTRPVFPSQSQFTDDRGIYRFFGLSPAAYTVAAGRDHMTFLPSRGVSYAEVFYPDRSEMTKATFLEASEGSEANNIDIVLGRPIDTFTASGRVVNSEKGDGVANVRVMIQRQDPQANFANAMTTTDGDGTFKVENLIPGKYLANTSPDINNDFRIDPEPFEVIDTDITGLTIRLIKGSSISGVLVLETEDKTAIAKLTQLLVSCYIKNAGTSRSTVASDGSFRVGGLGPGTASLQVSMPREVKGFSVTRIERDGQLQRGIEVKEGDQLTGVRIYVAYGNATLRGVVNIENGPLPSGSHLMVNLMRTGEGSPSLVNRGPVVVDDRGHFLIEGVPTGSYEGESQTTRVASGRCDYRPQRVCRT